MGKYIAHPIFYHKRTEVCAVACEIYGATGLDSMSCAQKGAEGEHFR